MIDRKVGDVDHFVAISVRKDNRLLSAGLRSLSGCDTAAKHKSVNESEDAMCSHKYSKLLVGFRRMRRVLVSVRYLPNAVE